MEMTRWWSSTINANLLAGILLVISATLKIHELAILPFTQNILFESRNVSIFLVCLELVLGVWLTTGWKAKPAKWVAATIFSVFCLSNLVLILNGSKSCGCFGVFSMPPAFTLAIDVVVLVLVLYGIPRETRDFPQKAAFLCVLTVLGVAFALFQLRIRTLEKIGTVIDKGDMIMLREENWIGEPLPLVGLIDGDEAAIEVGDWQVVLYHADCPKCESLLDSKELLASKTAFVQVPPYETYGLVDTPSLKWLRLSAEYDWFVVSPVIIELKDGVVISVQK
jgi:hypothetical protein